MAGWFAIPEPSVKDPYVLEFLGLKDEYSENDLEEALIHHLETFLLELGGDFCFVGRQKRLRIGTERSGLLSSPAALSDTHRPEAGPLYPC